MLEQLRGHILYTHTHTHVSPAEQKILSKVKRWEVGRTFTEVLSILVLMAILTVIAIVGFQSLMNKHRANVIIYDAKMAYMEAKARLDVSDNDWHPISHAFECNKTIETLRDKKQSDYVKVNGVEKAICKQALGMSVKNMLAFFNEDWTEMISCGDENNIVFAWGGLGAPAECENVADCGENFEGICNQDGHCQICDEASERLNEDGTACECDPNKALICQDEDENSWCCGPGLICDIENKSCKDGGGICQYTFTQQTQRESANCHYTIEDHDDGNGLHSITMEEKQGCNDDEYCYIAYCNEDCTSSISEAVGADGEGDAWGTCIQRTSNTKTCNISEISAGGLVEDQGCPAGQYCYIKWVGTNCDTTIADGADGPLFGACIDRTSNTVSKCPI